jgi:hypothetical protein
MHANHCRRNAFPRVGYGFVLLVALGPTPQWAQDEPPASPPTDHGSTAFLLKGADIHLLGSVRTIADEVERLRRESFDRPPLAVRVPESMRRVAAEIRAYNVLPRERLAARGEAWHDVGLGEPDTAASLLMTLASDLEGVGFDPAGNRLLVSPDRLTEKDFLSEEPALAQQENATVLMMMTGVRPDEPLVAHMLMHVRQRERTGGDSLQPMTDQLLARTAWAEGEANLVAVRYLFSGLNLADEVIVSGLDPGDFLDGGLLPPHLMWRPGPLGGLLRFVYLDGFAMAVEWYGRGGWQGLSAAMTYGTTTRDVLHPERAGRKIPAFAAPGPPAIDGVRLADEDSLGEQGIVVLISTLTDKDNLALQAADGWNGDRLYHWQGPEGGPVMTQWITRWVSPEEAADFEYGYTRALRARFTDGALLEVAPGSFLLEAPDRVYRVVRNGREVEIRVTPPELDRRLHGETRKASE